MRYVRVIHELKPDLNTQFQKVSFFWSRVFMMS